MTHLIVSGCKVEVLLVRDMFDKMERKTPNPRGLQGLGGGECSLSLLSTRQREPLVEGGGGESEKFKYAKRTSL